MHSIYTTFARARLAIGLTGARMQNKTAARRTIVDANGAERFGGKESSPFYCS